MAQAVILMTASRGCWIFGSGTVSTRTSPFPCQHSARMIVSFKCPAPTGETAKCSNGRAQRKPTRTHCLTSSEKRSNICSAGHPFEAVEKKPQPSESSD
jgi:hypothetical protein